MPLTPGRPGRVNPTPSSVRKLPDGEPGELLPPPPRDGRGRFKPSGATKAQAIKAGRASGEARKLGRLLGILDLPLDHPLEPYSRLSLEFRDAHMKELAANVGGGVVGAGPASIISTAALQMAASRWLFDLALESADDDLALKASRLADSSRQNLIAAHELVAREATARKKMKPAAMPWIKEGK